jgi:Holliday junction resolvasome RuvABC endonuclease subunit
MFKTRMSLILDQSTKSTGYAVCEESKTIEISYGVFGRIWEHGVLIPNGKDPVNKIISLKQDIRELIQEYSIDEIIMENTSWRGKNFHTDAVLGMLSVELKRLAKAHFIPIYLQHPSRVKKALTGKGNADKAEVIKNVVTSMGIPRKDIINDDHADALAGLYAWCAQGPNKREDRYRVGAKKSVKKTGSTGAKGLSGKSGQKRS